MTATTKLPIELDESPPVDGEAGNNLPDLPELDTVPPSDPPDVRAIGREAIVEAMVTWFFENFEDPAHNTPYDGGYVYIWGGPHTACEEIHDAFDGKASKRAIREAIKQIEADGIVDWAPAASRVQPTYTDKPNSD